MTEQRRTALKELQKLDLQIQEARQAIQSFDPLFEEIEEPALVLESELGTSRTRLKEMKLEQRRLELGSEEKRDRQKRLDERLAGVRNLREEAAVSAELEMVKRSLQNDEQEGFTLIDQIRKVEERLEEVEEAHKEAAALVEPKKEALLTERTEAKAAVASLEGERAAFVAGLSDNEIKTYDAIRANGRRIAVAELTEDGACGNCFGVVPLQLQNEIRHGAALIRCEGCGVILAAPEPVVEGAEDAADEVSAEDATEGSAATSEDADEVDPEVGEPAGVTAEDATEATEEE